MAKFVKILLVALILLAGSACGAKATPSSSAPARALSPRILEQAITPLDTPTDLPPTPTETLLPTAELPTPQSTTPILLAWVGAPTDPQSQPGYDFSVNYDASLWALAEDETGSLALLNRQIPYCKIAATGSGRGLPRGWAVDDQFRDIGAIRYEVVTASQNGVVQFTNYFGGDGIILTGFQVSFNEQGDSCIQMAEIVLASLASIVAPTPTATPQFTSTPSPTPTP
ncbi:MAG TPA: hypothetical protein VMC09_18490 [Anaerolineales bacterium]|nr:hypothetical protein [Anaerolineales bacterium]